jgi:hypothetical protein
MVDLSGVALSIGYFDVWGATFDGDDTVYISSVDGSSGSDIGDNLWTYTVSTEMFSQVGVITGAGGTKIRVDGLAHSGGVLYAYNQVEYDGNPAGLYSVDLTTFVASPVLLPNSSLDISGIDADPSTGIIYGVDDSSNSIVELDLVGGNVTSVAEYPLGVSDIDGLAAGPGTLYLVQDEPSPIDVFDIASLTYTGTIASPFTRTDTFSGAAFVASFNLPPDCSGAVPSISTIWPPNHKFVDIQVLGVTDPDGDPITITIVDIFQDELVDTSGDGSFAPDGKGVGTDTAIIRAERLGSGNGRVYHIFFTADDDSGGACDDEILVEVPHDIKDIPIDDGALYDSTIP